MDPQTKSILTSVGMALSTAVATWAASKGLIPSADQSTLANDLLMTASVAVTAGIGWYKAHMNSQAAMIKVINDTPNGVKVVAATAPSPQVNAPIIRTPPPPGALS